MSLLETLSGLSTGPAPSRRMREVELPEAVRTGHMIQPRVTPPPTPEPQILPEGYLRRILDNADSVPDRSRLGRGNYIHVSTLVNLCPRQYYLAHEHGTEDYADHIGQSWTGGHLVTFAMGRGGEGHVKSQVLRTMRERMYGLWKCRCGRASRLGMFDAARVCDRCGFPVDRYDEPVLRNEAMRIIGRPDITLIDDNRHTIVVEIKTMARAMWEELSEPKADHKVQGLLYHWLYAQERRPMNPNIVFIYITKDFRYGSPYKEYHLRADSDEGQSLLGIALGLAAQLREARDNQIAPPRILCRDQDCTRARNCPVRTLCFNME